MNDDRLIRLLRSVEASPMPREEFVDDLYAKLAAELARSGVRGVRIKNRAPRSRKGRTGLTLLAAAALVGLSLLGSGLAGRYLAVEPNRSQLPAVVATTSPSARPTVAPTPLPEGVLASISLPRGSAPATLVAAYGSIWVESRRGAFLYRIDPTTNTVVAQIPLAQTACGMPGIGFGRVWVSPCNGSTRTMVVDPETNQVVGSFWGGSLETAFADGSVWTTLVNTNKGTFQRIDPTSLKTLSTTVVGQTPSSAVVGAGFIWVADISGHGQYGGFISKVDPASGRVLATFPTPDPGVYPVLTFAFGSLWLKGEDPELLRIDPASGKVTTYPIAGSEAFSQFFETFPADGLGSLWMRIADGTVARVDPADGKVVATYPADPAGGGGYVTVGFGSLWVANYGSDTVWRVRIQ